MRSPGGWPYQDQRSIHGWPTYLSTGLVRLRVSVPGIAQCRRYRKLRDLAYEAGLNEFDALAQRASFRDFICMYIGEGSKRDRNQVAICNSDPAVVRLGYAWVTELTSKPISFGLQFHADQDPEVLAEFWSQLLGVDSELIKTQRKSNSNQLKTRTWRSKYGVLTVRVCDTYLRARLEAWMERLRPNGPMIQSERGPSRQPIRLAQARGVAQPGSASHLG